MSSINTISQNSFLANLTSSHSGKIDRNPSSNGTPAERKLHKAAAEFESLLLSNLWKSMKSSLASTDSDSDSDSDDAGHETLEELGIESMSSAVGKAGGLGIGKLILKHLEPKLADSQIGNSTSADKAQALSADKVR